MFRSLALLLLVSACRGPSTAPKATPLDFAALPGPTVFSAEATLGQRWPGSLETSHDAAEVGGFEGIDRVSIAYRVYRAATPRAAVVLVGGRTEPVRKYAELIDDLISEGFSVYAMDHRGQGASGRMLSNPDKGYVVNFDDYVEDLHTFVSTVVKPDVARPVFLVAHSMGGAVGALTVDEYPDDFAAVVFSSPMFEIDTGGFPAPIASTIGAAACGATDGAGYAVGAGDFTEETDFDANTVTQSVPRFEWKRRLFAESPELRLGGITWRWLCESLVSSSAAERTGPFSSTPTLILQAGDDRFVKPGGQARYCEAAPRCQLSRIDEARHEHFAEKDALRNVAVERTLKFLVAQEAR